MGKTPVAVYAAPRRSYVIIVGCAVFAVLSVPHVLQATWLQILLTHIALYAFILNGVLVFVALRHLQLIANRRIFEWPQIGDRASQPANYFLFVMGSGGHTREMLMMMDDGTCDFAGFHRRYLISSGDTMSLDHVQEHEREIRELCSQKGLDPGTYDTRIVTRARRVHQPLWTTPFTGILSIIDIFPALLIPPEQGSSSWPQRIYSNGPATGFFVAVVAHFLRMFFLAPEESMRFLYIESWARTSTLSLTGKLLHYTGLADVFVVQHKEVGERYGIKCVGQIVFNSRRTETSL